MWLTRLALRFSTATKLAGCLVPRSCSVFVNRKILCASYSSQLTQRQQVPPHNWLSLETELDDILVPRMMSLSPLESLLSSRYSLPKPEALNTIEPPEQENSYKCPTHQDDKDMDENTEEKNIVQCKNVLKIRRRKMNKHKYKKLQKRMKFLKRKIKDGRRRRQQLRFERDLKRIWKKAGLEKAPDGWQVPKIYVKH
ncbi:aurora kinase A-interacting protein [Xenopus tropicalis]|uniref:Small ribosomal subunit protein mS38 n=1 Tax=Xenopus tropicalis TaxID=8364 RepID=Q28JA5_XENTR|nr:small ribosomal subunit protein mS38 [Xenopus tropicalis]CAJ82791.1 aurora kinase A interacting protein 1 [Xenopus tropicalis]|eukprot:NP_001016966.1 aurora kinase A-interacting protein [Xenopus tropicalis]